MTIAIDISAGRNGIITERFHFRCFSRIAAGNPSHHFIFIFDSHPDPELYLEPNCTPVIVSPVIKNSLLRHYWYNYKIPSLLERYNADIFVTAGSTCSLRTKVPQCMIIESLTLSDKKTGSYWKKFMPAFLKTAQSVCVTNPVIADELIKRFGAEPEKITMVFPGTDHDERVITETEKNEIKSAHTEGKDFFFYEGNAAGLKNLITFLKAFTIFKKWQRSELQLVVVMKMPPEPELSKQLSLYKYKTDVHFFTQDKDTLLLPAAYAAIVFNDDRYPAGALNAARIGIPLILNESRISRIFFQDAVLYTALTESDIAAKMMLLYKDEHLRSLQINKGINITNAYSWDRAAASLWELLASNTNK